MFHFHNYGRKGKSPSNTPTYLVTFSSLGQVVKETSEDVIKAAEADEIVVRMLSKPSKTLRS